MFDFFSMQGNHAIRKVDTYQKDGLFIDTCSVNDGAHPYETAVESRLYNNGKMVIVEAYDTKNDAQKGHDKWVEIMVNNPPEKLIDCQNSYISSLFLDEDDLTFPAVD